ncbi:DNA methyltransferase [Mesorhizobium sp.]|uniref:DNA-methyltransferase n=1 Tax=Mesorhizobium sp. TaxID=1871066 RepID=UPI0025797B16|nr:DNA methyltransferase [Mesorhizobium sp.]
MLTKRKRFASPTITPSRSRRRHHLQIKGICSDMTGKTEFLDGRVSLLSGDCRERLKSLPDNSVDAVVTDPPYALESIRNRFGGENAVPAQHGKDGAFARLGRGFMGKQWDTGEVAFDPEFWRDVLRVLKPGGFLVAFSGTRTYHHMTSAIDAAGFEVRDSMLQMMASDTAVIRFLETLSAQQVEAFFRCLEESTFGGMLAWCYGTGMPHGLNVSKAIDKHLGAEREKKPVSGAPAYQRSVGNTRPWMDDPDHMVDGDLPVTPEAAEWQGWNTNLKPAWEPICMARKPLDGTVAENILAHGTGGINVGACKIDAEKVTGWSGNAAGGGTWTDENSGLCKDGEARPSEGRYPANIITDGSAEVAAAFPTASGAQGRVTGREPSASTKNTHGKYDARAKSEPRDDSGSAVRFFYSGKADGDDRLGSLHPTVKPVDVMRWLVRLVCRKGGTVLDPFAGTGTTGEAAFWEGCNAILIEREEEYQRDIAKRMSLVLAGPDTKKRARTEIEPAEGLPLFGEATVAHVSKINAARELAIATH